MINSDAPHPGRSRRSVPWIIACAVAGLGVLVNAASVPGPLSPVLAPVPRYVDHAYLLALFPAAGFIAGLLTVRWWGWALAAGAALTVPAAVLPLIPATYGIQAVAYLALAGPPLALVAILAAAQELLAARAVAAGVVVAALTVGAGLAGAALVGPGWLRAAWDPIVLRLGLSLVAVAGGVLAAVRRDSGGGPWPRPRLIVIGALAALLSFVPAVVTDDRVAAVLQVSQASLARRSYVLVAIVGLIILGCAVPLAVLAGIRTCAGISLAVLVQVGSPAPLVLALWGTSSEPGAGPAFAGAGLAVGAAAAASRHRAAAAAAGAVTSALVLLLLSAATGGVPEKVVTQARWIPAGLLLALLVATVTCAVGAAARHAAGNGGLPAALGPIAGALVTGGASALSLTQLNDGEPEPSYLAGGHHMTSSVVLLFVAALVAAGTGLTGLIAAHRDEAGATG